MKKTGILIISNSKKGGMKHYFEHRFSNCKKFGLNVHYIKSKSILQAKNQLLQIVFTIMNLRNWYALVKLILQNKIKIVHFLDSSYLNPMYMIFCKCLGTKIYFTVHDPVLHSGENIGIKGRSVKFFQKMSCLLSDKIVVHGDPNVSKTLKEYGFLKSHNIVSIQHGLYDEFVKPDYTKTFSKPKVLFFGRIVEYKGIGNFLDAACILQKKGRSDIKFYIAGEGDLNKYTDQITLLGDMVILDNFFIRDSDITKYFKDASVTILPYTDATGTGIIPLSYAYATPVIASNIPELAQNVVEGKTGLLTKPNDPGALADAIERIVFDKKKLIEMSKNCTIYAQTELSWTKQISITYSINNDSN